MFTFAHLRAKLTYANVTATLALVLALGGTATAAALITGRQVKDNSLTSADIRNGSLLGKDFKAHQLPRGARGPAGRTGLPGQAGHDGAPGSAKAYGAVSSTGTLDTTRSSPGLSVSHATTGSYCINLPASIDADRQVVIAIPDGSDDSTFQDTSGQGTGSFAHLETITGKCGTNGVSVFGYDVSRSNAAKAGVDVVPTDEGFTFVVP